MQRKPYPKNPMYSSRTLLYHVFSMVMKGTTIDKIRKYCRSIGSNGAPSLIRIIRSGGHREIKWETEERNGRIKVKNIKET